jgi:DNA-binding NtrC family response regulator
VAPSGTKARASAEATRVLVVDDEPALRRSLARTLMTGGFSVDTAESGAAALDLLRARAIDVVLLDRAMPEMDGLAALARMRQLHPTVEVVMMTAAGDPEGAGAALRAGAYDVVQKAPASPGLLCLPVERAAERRRLSLRVRALEQRIAEHDPLGELIGASTRMQELHRRAFAAAPSASTVLVLGERGTGKELLARAVHRRSNRGREPLQVLNLSAVPEDQVEAELFGGGPGRPGAFALADGGTLLLDEVGDLPVAAQARLLRAVTHGEIRAAGAAESRTVDVRVISTSHADLRDRVAAGLFREDLFYRLSVIPLEIPPLRRRREDIALLAYHFLQRCAARGGRKIQRISAEALRKLREHPWPGNVRELEAAIEHAAVMAQGDALLPGDLPLGQPPPGDDDADPALELVTGDLAQLSYGDAKERAVDAFDRVYLERLMQRSAGNVSEAARLAGMDRSNFRRLLKKVRGRPSGDRARRAGGAPTPQGEDRCVEDDGED